MFADNVFVVENRMQSVRGAIFTADTETDEELVTKASGGAFACVEVSGLLGADKDVGVRAYTKRNTAPRHQTCSPPDIYPPHSITLSFSFFFNHQKRISYLNIT